MQVHVNTHDIIQPTWVVSDTHFGHARIQEFYPMRLAWGATVTDMTATMIRAWSERVGPEDIVLHIGDFAMGHKETWPRYRAQLTGRLLLVIGNHDRRFEEWLRPDDIAVDRFEFVHPQVGTIVCRHNPAEFTEEDAQRASVLLHGHLHSGTHRQHPLDEIVSKCLCASVEVLPGPGPMLLDEFLMRMPRAGLAPTPNP